MMRRFIIFCGAVLLTGCLSTPQKSGKIHESTLQIQTQPQGFMNTQEYPMIVAEKDNLNDFGLFADGGWDGNWYVGYNTCWVSELPPAPGGDYVKAFIGAKLGRAKNRQIEGKPSWRKEAVPGEIYMAISSTPVWKDGRLLTRTEAIPFEPDPENAVLEVGESRWFWVEIPLQAVSRQPSKNPNFLALWSPTKQFISADTSPILAAGWAGKTAPLNSWLNKEIQGTPPTMASESLKTGISYFEPAMAIKLIPPNRNPMEIRLVPLSATSGNQIVFLVQIKGDEIARVWLEAQTSSRQWIPYAMTQWSAPYVFTLNAEDFQAGTISLRAHAADIWENTVTSAVYTLKAQSE